ncbi:MAG: hypothetical protein J6Q85_05240 [Clostridia bacterium]|nr:hypothetical protein [Clostridia bacterium]
MDWIGIDWNRLGKSINERKGKSRGGESRVEERKGEDGRSGEVVVRQKQGRKIREKNQINLGCLKSCIFTLKTLYVVF